MGYKKNSKLKFINKKKKSSLAIHKGCPELLSVPIGIDKMAKIYFSYIETGRYLACAYGENSLEYDNGLRALPHYKYIDLYAYAILSYFEKSKINPILLLESYYVESPYFSVFNVNPDDFVVDDIYTLNRVDLSLVFFKICHENYLKDMSAYKMFQIPFISDSDMRNALSNNTFLNVKYNGLKRNSVIDSILS